MVTQSHENLTQVFPMFMCIPTGNEDVIKVCITVGEALQDLVDEPLEGLGCIDQAKWHASELE